MSAPFVGADPDEAVAIITLVGVAFAGGVVMGVSLALGAARMRRWREEAAVAPRFRVGDELRLAQSGQPVFVVRRGLDEYGRCEYDLGTRPGGPPDSGRGFSEWELKNAVVVR